MAIKSLVIILLVLYLCSVSFGHDGPPDPRRIVYIQHQSYIYGIIKGVQVSGGYRTLDHRDIMDRFISDWKDAMNGFIAAAKIRKETLGEGQELSSEWILNTYRDYLERKGIQCNNPIWSDTGTLQYCK